MRDRLFRARRDPRSPSDEDAVGYDEIARRLGVSGPDEAADETDSDAAWDAPTEARAPTDEDAGGAPWDRPGHERFAPPPPRDVHWAFRAPDTDTSAWPAPDDRYGSPSQDEEGAWDADLDARRGGPADGPWSWEDAPSLVTAGGGPRTEVPRDPAQPGLFDPYDAFAPVIADDGWTLPPRFPGQATAPTTEPDPGSAPAPVPASPRPLRGDRRAPRESVFGDLFAPAPGDARESEDAMRIAVERDEAAALETPDGEESRDSAPPRAPGDAPVRPDPRDWPPIPSGLLPPIPQPTGSGPSTASTEPDGRRFAWPPPQPRISPVSTVASDDARQAAALDQPTLWARDGDRVDAAFATATPANDAADPSDDVSGSRLAAATEATATPTFGRPAITLKVVAVAALTVAALVLVAQFVLSLVR